MEKMLEVASGFQYAVNIGFDLNNDEKFENDQEVADAEMRITIEQMLAAMPSSILRKEFLEKIEHTEPFCAYPDLISEFRSREG